LAYKYQDVYNDKIGRLKGRVEKYEINFVKTIQFHLKVPNMIIKHLRINQSKERKVNQKKERKWNQVKKHRKIKM